MRIEFTKMEGCGNDYVYVDGAKHKIPAEDKPELVQRLSDRHFGIGGDGVIFINPAEDADFEMEMWNADGTRAEMCGNGIRCVAKFVYDYGMTSKEQITIVSAGQKKILDLTVKDGVMLSARVNMGEPILKPVDVPVDAGKLSEYFGPYREKDTQQSLITKAQTKTEELVQNAPLCVYDGTYYTTCVSMGNPHSVIVMNDVKDLDLEKMGTFFEHHPAFPKRTNTEFVKIIDKNTVEMRVWERGTGETLACGTGSCATAVACILNGLTDNKVLVKLLGGELLIEWEGMGHPVYMSGPARISFTGVVEV